MGCSASVSRSAVGRSVTREEAEGVGEEHDPHRKASDHGDELGCGSEESDGAEHDEHRSQPGEHALVESPGEGQEVQPDHEHDQRRAEFVVVGVDQRVRTDADEGEFAYDAGQVHANPDSRRRNEAPEATRADEQHP